MRPEFDPFPLSVPDRDPQPPALVGYLEGGAGTVMCSSPQEMADTFGSPIFAPREWPAGAVLEQQIVVRPGVPAGGDRYYLLLARRPATPAPLIVWGYFGAPLYENGVGGVWSAPELAGVNGAVFEGPASVSLSLEREGQSIALMSFPSAAEAVATARSIERYEPSTR